MALSVMLWGTALEPLADGLAAQGFVVSGGKDPEHAALADVVLLDESDQSDVETLREAGAVGPLLALSQQPIDGVDERLPKPVRLGALLARLNAYATAIGVTLGPWQFVEATRSLRATDGTLVKLTPKETEILAYLMACEGAVSRADLLFTLWGYSDQAATHTVETHIHGLRRKLGPDLLVTDAGGYSLKIN